MRSLLGAHRAKKGAILHLFAFFFFSSRRRHTRYWRDWSSDVCSSDLIEPARTQPDHFLSFEVIDREKEMVRLGAGGLDGRALTPEAMHAALQVLSKLDRKSVV